ncbi:glycoside hydrolase family 9 protein [uncultured Dokdonia sp.]|uniref:glycoside hydrolase family 9 protein n=1 Tax=uncultured Dokdonia sp. TaxID=575653 RepID=UPI002619A66F|nr:glycoside hydrolase family 9 protein [uncultured Dokdonia sp.]
MRNYLLLLTTLILVSSCKEALPKYTTNSANAFRINQVGYYPEALKKAIITDTTQATTFYLIDQQTRESIFEGPLSETYTWDLAGETVRIADFSDFTTPGSYSVYIENIGYSYPFEIKKKVLTDVFTASVKSLYYQRASTALDEKYAGVWARNAGHLDTEVTFHPSSGRTGTIASPKGWYDAGDFGKYVINGAFPLGQMMTLYEQYPNVLPDMSLNIPESGNKIPDILDEFKYELDWLLTMQDDDGGVFFKLTTKRFTDMTLPEEGKAERFIIGKGTAPSLDLAGVAAKGYRLYKDIDTEFADRCLASAKMAWEWAKNNSDIAFKNPEDILTGEYGDANFSEEWYWAAAELYLSTGEQEYENYLREHAIRLNVYKGGSWNNYMKFIAAFALIDQAKNTGFVNYLKENIIQAADTLVATTKSNDYFQPITVFNWGSNSDVLNAAMIIAQAYRITKKPEYLTTVLEITDYVFGKNATGYSFITGHGDKTPINIHHRQSAGDGIEAPVPGFISGGPNMSKQDRNDVTYPENTFPMNSWVDQTPSYASNEICLNWNSAAIYVLGFLEQESK